MSLLPRDQDEAGHWRFILFLKVLAGAGLIGVFWLPFLIFTGRWPVTWLSAAWITGVAVSFALALKGWRLASLLVFVAMSTVCISLGAVLFVSLPAFYYCSFIILVAGVARSPRAALYVTLGCGGLYILALWWLITSLGRLPPSPHGGDPLMAAWSPPLFLLAFGGTTYWLSSTLSGLTWRLSRSMMDIEQKSRDIESFVMSVSHDLKNPIVSISGFAELLERGDVDDKQRSLYLQRIRANAERLHNQVQGLLEYIRVGQEETLREFLSLDDIVREALGGLVDTAQQRNIQFHVQENMPDLFGDRRQLVSLVHNLASNAIRYGCSEPNPSIIIGARNEGTDVVFWVRDNGRGIDPAHHKSIFRIFYRVNPEKPGGTGIGLAMVASIVERHRGRIWLESQPGKGATFYVLIPNRPTEFSMAHARQPRG